MSSLSDSSADARLSGFYRVLASFYKEKAAVDGHLMLGRVAEELSRVASSHLGRPQQCLLPVVRLLGRLEQNSGSLLGRFVELAGELPWLQNPSYLNVFSRELQNDYGYIRLLGPTDEAIAYSGDVAVSLGVWRAGLCYPPHLHPAEEVYHVLAGQVGIAGADDVYRELFPGVGEDVAHNESGIPHALRVGPPDADPELASPCVLLWSWTGRIDECSVLL